MAFSLPFFRKKTDNAQKPSSTRKQCATLPQSNSSHVVGGFPSANHVEDCNRRLSPGMESCRHIRIEIPDFDCELFSIPENRSSQLSKTLAEILKDKDALAYLIPYLEVRGAVNLVRFWLEAETFRESASYAGLRGSKQSPQLPSQSSSRIISSSSSTHQRDADTCSPASVEQPPSACSTYSSSQNANNQQSASNCVLSAAAAAETRQNCSGAHGHCRDTTLVSNQNTLSSLVSATKSNFTDTGASDPQRGVIRDRSSADISNVSPPECRHSSSGASESVVVVVEASGLALAKDASTAVDVSMSECSVDVSASGGSEEFPEALRRNVERDAVAIFSKYLAHDSPCPISVTNALRQDAVHRICRGADKGVDMECFVECQRHVTDLLNAEYFPEFKQSVYHCNHQINVLTGSILRLGDFLYDDTAFSYFTEFMEAEGVTEVLQCYIDLDNFQHLMATLHGGVDGGAGGSAAAQMQGDSVILYDKYFSLQATRSLRFEEHVRKEVENNMSREDGDLRGCFATPRRIAYCYMEQLFLPQFLKSNLYYKYLSDLINTVHCAQDVVMLPARKRRGSDTVSERSSSSAGNEQQAGASRNTLLAMDTRGQHMKRAMSNVQDDMRIDSSLFDPDNLWRRPQAENKMTFGRVNELGQFISDFDPGPSERDKKGLGTLFVKRNEKSQTQEEMALQVAQMILNEVAMANNSGEFEGRSDVRGHL